MNDLITALTRVLVKEPLALSRSAEYHIIDVMVLKKMGYVCLIEKAT